MLALTYLKLNLNFKLEEDEKIQILDIISKQYHLLKEKYEAWNFSSLWCMHAEEYWRKSYFCELWKSIYI